MKAILEIDVPQSCEECPLMHYNASVEVCAATKKFPNDALRRKERAFFCPLKIEEEDTNGG